MDLKGTDMPEKGKLLGILGGLGPMATVYFYELLTSKTKAFSDQDHIDIIISSRATTPDRSSYITGKSKESPLPVMIDEACRLESGGADLLVMPCNTAHYFYDELTRTVKIPFINIVDETVKYCKSHGYRKVGILATEGTVYAGAYQKICEKNGIEYALPSEENQKKLQKIIFENIKQGKSADMVLFSEITAELKEKSCDAVILGCTELSLIKKDEHLGKEFVDSMEVLAEVTIRACGKEIREDAAE